MIPKIIHYCWFGKKEKPDEVINYIKTWKKKCPDYIIKEWNEQNFDINYNQYVSQAYNVGKYAFVSDVCRMYALYCEGGIYLDTDVEVINKFDNYLDNDSFLCEEQRGRLLGTATIGAKPNVKWIKDFLTLYNTISFIQNNGKYDILPNTSRLTMFMKEYKEKKPTIYPIDYFCAKDYQSGKINITQNTICIHHYASSWVEPLKFQLIESKFWKLMGIKHNLNISGKLYWKIIMPIKNLISSIKL